MSERSPLVRVVRVAVGLLVASIAIAALRLFPWHAAAAALAEARPAFLATAVSLHLLAHTTRAGAWHLLLKPRAPHRLSSAIMATFAGEAVSVVSIAVGGEVVRATLVQRRDGVPLSLGGTSIAASRIVEGLALLGVIALVAPFLPRSPAVLTLQWTAWGLLLVLLILVTTRLGPALFHWLPRIVRELMAPVFGPRVSLSTPLLLGVVNWGLEWATYHVCIVATCGPVPLAASLLAVVATNVGGALRLTPGNAGVLQVGVAAALVPLGVAAPAALAAGLVLQTVQAVPVLLLGSVLGARVGVQPVATGRC